MAYAKDSWDWFVARGLDKYLGKQMMSKNEGMFTVTQGGMLAGGNMSRLYVQWFLESNGTNDTTDGYGTYVSDYMAKAQNSIIDAPWVDTTGYPSGATGCQSQEPITPPPPPKINPIIPYDVGFPKETFVEFAKKWWKEEFLPALKDMTAQIYAYRVFQTWELGRMTDAVDINRTARVEQEQRVTSQQTHTPNEQICVAGSFRFTLAQTSRTADALTRGYRKDLEKRGNNFIAEVFGKPMGADPAQDQKLRWDEYCKHFFDPDTNNRISACTGAPEPARIINGDISIESFLLKDTIDMSKVEEYKSAEALLQNLVQPLITYRLPDKVIDTAIGKEYLLRMQHLTAINNIARDVVASIIARRTGSAPSPGPVGGKSVADMVKEIRIKAGIDPSLISDNPSYNEIMQALTKERFFGPEYFVRMANNAAAIKQEQTAVSAYITIQMQDIYRLQEQINALLAARAALKVQSDKSPGRVEAAPIK
jgi:hypothetical protein